MEIGNCDKKLADGELKISIDELVLATSFFCTLTCRVAYCDKKIFRIMIIVWHVPRVIEVGIDIEWINTIEPENKHLRGQKGDLLYSNRQ